MARFIFPGVGDCWPEPGEPTVEEPGIYDGTLSAAEPGGRGQTVRTGRCAFHVLILGMDNRGVRVLVVEDELKMATLLRRGLVEQGYAADIARTGRDALRMAQATAYDAILLDVMLPDLDGFEVCRELRQGGVWSPVLMLTARDGVGDRVTGLDSGADDYLAKPFSFVELLARLRALTRRGRFERPTVLRVGLLRLDPATRQTWRGDVPIELSAREFALLEMFMRRPGQVLSRQDLIEHTWDHSSENRSNVVDVYVGYLRAKIDRPFGGHLLETVRGAGYRLRQDGGG